MSRVEGKISTTASGDRTRESFEETYVQYLALMETMFEQRYQEEVAPVIEDLIEGAREREILERVVDHWKTTRLRAWEQPLPEPAGVERLWVDNCAKTSEPKVLRLKLPPTDES